MIEHCNHSSDTDDCKDSSKSDTDKFPAGEKSHADRDGNIKDVKAVFSKSYAGMHRVGNCLDNTVSRIRNETHVQRHCSTDAGQDDCNNEKTNSSHKASGKLITICIPKIRDQC